jgi:hypothetical protein
MEKPCLPVVANEFDRLRAAPTIHSEERGCEESYRILKFSLLTNSIRV